MPQVIASIEFVAKLAGESQTDMMRYVRRWGIVPSERVGSVQTFSLREIFASLVALILHKQGINNLQTIQKAIRYCLKGNVEDRGVEQGQRFMVATEHSLTIATGMYVEAKGLNKQRGVVVVDLLMILNRMMHHEQIGAEAI